MSKKTIDQAKIDYLLDPANKKDPDDRKGRKTQYAKPKTGWDGLSKNSGDAEYEKNAKKAKDQLMDEVKTGKKITKKKPSRIGDYDTTHMPWTRR